MKNNVNILFSLLIGTALVLFILNQKNKQSEADSLNPSTAATNRVVPDSVKQKPAAVARVESPHDMINKNKDQNQKEETPTLSEGPLSTQEIESINNIIKTISQTIAKKLNSNQFMKAIQALQLKPKFIDEGSNALGSMVTVRTHDALPGTRYLHAQFIGEKNNAHDLQHISFQIRPGSNAFQKAVEILNQYLPKNKTVKESDSDYVLYNTEDGYVAWAKIATREDLKANKYNASSKEDVGSVIVTIEQEIHDMDDDGHSH